MFWLRQIVASIKKEAKLVFYFEGEGLRQGFTR
jgi:hypothetical protein